MKKYSNPQTAAKTMAIPACCPPVGLSRLFPDADLRLYTPMPT